MSLILVLEKLWLHSVSSILLGLVGHGQAWSGSIVGGGAIEVKNTMTAFIMSFIALSLKFWDIALFHSPLFEGDLRNLKMNLKGRVVKNFI